MRQKFTAEVSSLKEIRKFVQDKLTENNINSKVIQDVILGVGEASMNIVKHGYKGGNEKDHIEVFVKIDEKQIEINFFDNGIPVVPQNIKPRDLGDIKPGGLGSYFMSETMDEVKWETKSKDWINHLILVKYL